MATTELVDGVPYWTEKMYKPGGGQDHLGLGSVVTDRILPRLSPGINVLTIHPRYWSFYTFVLGEFWKRDLPRTKAALRSRPRIRKPGMRFPGSSSNSPSDILKYGFRYVRAARPRSPKW